MLNYQRVDILIGWSCFQLGVLILCVFDLRKCYYFHRHDFRMYYYGSSTFTVEQVLFSKKLSEWDDIFFLKSSLALEKVLDAIPLNRVCTCTCNTFLMLAVECSRTLKTRMCLLIGSEYHLVISRSIWCYILVLWYYILGSSFHYHGYHSCYNYD